MGGGGKGKREGAGAETREGAGAGTREEAGAETREEDGRREGDEIGMRRETAAGDGRVRGTVVGTARPPEEEEMEEVLTSPLDSRAWRREEAWQVPWEQEVPWEAAWEQAVLWELEVPWEWWEVWEARCHCWTCRTSPDLTPWLAVSTFLAYLYSNSAWQSSMQAI